MSTFGPNILTGGTISSASDRVGYLDDYALDGDENTRWASTDWYVPNYWQYDLGAGVTKQVQKVGFITKSAEIPNNFSILGSNNGTDWVLIYVGTGANNQNWQYYEFINPYSYRYYRFLINTVYSGVVASLSEIAMYECTSNDIAGDWRLVSGVVSTSADRFNYETYFIQDGYTPTRWATPDGQTTAWVKLDLGAGRECPVTKLEFITVSTEIPHAFVFAGSNDNSSWIDLLSSNGDNVQTWQTFSIPNSTYYRYYRLSVSTVWAGNVVSISELRLWEAWPRILFQSPTRVQILG